MDISLGYYMNISCFYDILVIMGECLYLMLDLCAVLSYPYSEHVLENSEGSWVFLKVWGMILELLSRFVALTD